MHEDGSGHDNEIGSPQLPVSAMRRCEKPQARITQIAEPRVSRAASGVKCIPLFEILIHYPSGKEKGAFFHWLPRKKPQRGDSGKPRAYGLGIGRATVEALKGRSSLRRC